MEERFPGITRNSGQEVMSWHPGKQRDPLGKALLLCVGLELLRVRVSS